MYNKIIIDFPYAFFKIKKKKILKITSSNYLFDKLQNVWLLFYYKTSDEIVQ